MKKLLFAILSLLLVAGTVSAQEGKKAFKDAQKALNTYNLGGQTDTESLRTAASNIEVAIKDAELSSDSKTWTTRGEIYNSMVSNYSTMRMVNPDIQILDDEAAYKAYESFKTALEKAEKKWETKEALKGLQITANNLSNMGVELYDKGSYDKAYEHFNAVLEIRKLMNDNGEKVVLVSDEDYHNQIYITGLAALNANNLDAATPLFTQLYDFKYDKPAVYDALYKIKAKSNPDEAIAILETGRQKYPDDVSLLFTEINHYLTANKMDVLVDKLKTAIEKEPENLSLYSTLGNVYDNLYQRAAEAGNAAEADKNFEEALKYYNMTLEKDAEFFDAIYSIGALYYNKAAAMTQEMNKLAEDYSKEGIKKYEAAKAQVFEQFDKALPYFQRSEKLNPSDRNTLIALKEIYARKDQLEVSNEFKTRLETLEGGGSVQSSYFKSKGM